MTLTIKFPAVEMMKMRYTPIVSIPMNELIDTRQIFVLIWREPSSPLHQLPKEIVMHILNSCEDIFLTQVRQKAFEKIIPKLNIWHFVKLPEGPEWILLINEAGKEIASDQNLMDCLSKTTAISAIYKKRLGV